MSTGRDREMGDESVSVKCPMTGGPPGGGAVGISEVLRRKALLGSERALMVQPREENSQSDAGLAQESEVRRQQTCPCFYLSKNLISD